MLVPFKTTRVTANLGGVEIALETGRMANQADGAIWVQSGGTVVLVTAVTQPLPEDKGFFPLVCHYQEMSYAAGRIPGGYFRREIGRPSERETLVSRLMDRPIRPLFPKGFKDEVQIIATVLSADRNVNPDVLALTGASAALHVSKIPFMGPIAGARVGLNEDGEFVLFPTYQGMAENGDLNLVLAASTDAVVMVEGAAQFVPEAKIADAIAWGHAQLKPLFDAQEELREKLGAPKLEVTPPVVDEALAAEVRELAASDLAEALQVLEKMPRREAMATVKERTLLTLQERHPENETLGRQVKDLLGGLEKEIVRERISKHGVRIDGRDLTTVRPLSIDVGLLPQTHGSALFRRGETSALCIATLGSSRDEQRIETLIGEKTKSFMLHYNFPPFSVGEVKMLRGPSRREIGHGNLAERAIKPVLPAEDEFPFTIRVVSEVMDSNGSSSMATVCGSSLALMDAGVPMSDAVAGIAMGLAKVGDEFYVLTDILGDEDALGDMDFKVAGTRDGITAVQMDIKIAGIPQEVLARALEQARAARLHILDRMATVLAEPRPELSQLAPQHQEVWINPEKIRELIGPGGKNIKAITAETEASIDIEDSGRVSIFAPTHEAMKMALERVQFYDQTPELGKDYVGVVKKITDFGAYVEILPGLDGMLHVSQLDVDRVENVSDLLSVGQEVTSKVVEIEDGGRVRLSRKAWLLEQAGKEIDLADFGRPKGAGGPRGGGDRGPRGGGRGGDRRGPRRD